MDPLTALGLASNIIQFIDFTTKLISASTSLYKSSSGATSEHLEIEEFARDIRQRAEKLLLPERSSENGYPAEDSSLRIVAHQCREVADELLAVLSSLKLKEPNARWQSFYQALRSEWKQDAIDMLRQRLDRLCDQIGTRLNTRFQERVLAKFYELATDNARLASSRAADIQSLREDFQDLIDEIKTSREGEDKTEEHGLQRATLIAQSGNLALAAGKGLEYNAEQLILNYLRFDAMDARLNSTSTAHMNTFSWIFDRDDTSVALPSSQSLARWLLSDDQLFWISGKPGSGKSTLMKYISEHPQTVASLQSWAGDHQLITANFFFWAPGRASLQKSQEGLLRSILYQVLRQRPSSIRLVLPDQWRYMISGDGTQSGSSLDMMNTADLLAAFQRTSEHLKESAVRFCFFIDGLDEYEGKPEDVIQLVWLILNSNHIKVCASSRPWNEFEKAFGQDSEKKLYMQDLTRGDIEGYVRATLEEDSSFQELANENIHYTSLVRDIVDAAKGVFLWVVLVVRSLLEGITNSDRISDLQRRLQLLPTDLNEYFERILFTVNDFYREETAYAFQITLASPKILPLMIYWFIDQEETDPALDLPMKAMSDDKMRDRERTMTKRLNARCKGLLESSKERSNGSITVDFLHRTLLDFLRIPKTQKLLTHWSSTKPDPNLAICKAVLAQVKTAPRSQLAGTSREKAIDYFLNQASSLEECGCSAALEVQLVDQLQIAITSHMHAKNGVGRYERLLRQHGSILIIAARHGLRRYVDVKVGELPTDERDPILSRVLTAESANLLAIKSLHGVEIAKSFLARADTILQTWNMFLHHIETERKFSSAIVHQIVKEILERGVALGARYPSSIYAGEYSPAEASSILRKNLTADEFGSLGEWLLQSQAQIPQTPEPAPVEHTPPHHEPKRIRISLKKIFARTR